MYNPLALHMLRAALADADITAFTSPAPGGLGLSLILAAKAEPNRQWAAHLASFGAQVGPGRGPEGPWRAGRDGAGAAQHHEADALWVR